MVRKMKVLIVDDSMMVRNSLKRMLSARGIPDLMLADAPDGAKGLALFEREEPDILIVDLLMPVMEGTEVVRQLGEKQHKCFIAVLSSNFQKPVKERLLGLGAHLFVEKPVTEEKLDSVMKEYDQFRKSLT